MNKQIETISNLSAEALAEAIIKALYWLDQDVDGLTKADRQLTRPCNKIVNDL